MKIELNKIDECSIEDFADRYGLVMRINERPVDADSNERFYACFRDADIKDGAMLVGLFGNGSTPENAIEEYASKISTRKLVLHAFSKQRVEIQVPRLV